MRTRAWHQRTFTDVENKEANLRPQLSHLTGVRQGQESITCKRMTDGVWGVEIDAAHDLQ
jgi:hypothetical protein